VGGVKIGNVSERDGSAMICDRGQFECNAFDEDAGAVFSTLSGIVLESSESATKAVLQKLMCLLNNKNISKHLDKMFPYLYTAGFLAFAGREINGENISKVLHSVGMKPHEDIEKMLLSTCNIKNCLIDIYACYFLMVMGSEVNEENLLKVLGAIKAPQNKAAAREVMVMYNKRQIP
jgi:ribosomal protein L12E/L44/L45/RPP1/RPP2